MTGPRRPNVRIVTLEWLMTFMRVSFHPPRRAHHPPTSSTCPDQGDQRARAPAAVRHPLLPRAPLICSTRATANHRRSRPATQPSPGGTDPPLPLATSPPKRRPAEPRHPAARTPRVSWRGRPSPPASSPRATRAPAGVRLLDLAGAEAAVMARPPSRLSRGARRHPAPPCSSGPGGRGARSSPSPPPPPPPVAAPGREPLPTCRMLSSV